MPGALPLQRGGLCSNFSELQAYSLVLLYDMSNIIRYNKELKPYVRSLRNKMTSAEKKLWYKIRCRAIHGVQFCRQMPIKSYIIDFYAKELKIALEVDGSIHLSAFARNKDQNRDYVLSTLGIKVLRFTNENILTDIESVILSISAMVLKNLPL